MNIREQIDQIKKISELKVVTAEVSCQLEVAALCRKEFRQPHGGSALFFSQVEKSPFRVAANLLGSEKRAALLYKSSSLQHFSGKLKETLLQKEGNAEERVRQLQSDGRIRNTEETNLKHSLELSLNDLPAIKSWPEEGGRYLTLAVAVTVDLELGNCNLGLYRAQVIDSDRLAINFSPGSGAADHLNIAAKKGKCLPICLFLGSDPSLLWTAAAALPHDCDDYLLNQSLFGSTLQLTPGLSQPVGVPADSEMVIEGEIDPKVTALEGPFGNHTGQYVTRPDCPVMKVTAIRHQVDAIMPITVVGPPPSENVYLAQGNEIFIKEMLKIDYPCITDLRMPLDTIFHGATLITVKRQSAASMKELIFSLWGQGPLRKARLIILLDDDINLQSLSQSWWRTVNCLSYQKIYEHNNQVAIDATGINRSNLVLEDHQTQELIERRRHEYPLC